MSSNQPPAESGADSSEATSSSQGHGPTEGAPSAPGGIGAGQGYQGAPPGNPGGWGPSPAYPPPHSTGQYGGYNPNLDPQAKSKLVTGLLGVFVGGFGIHNFYLGKNQLGVIQIVVTILTCGIGAIWGFIEGILYIIGYNGYTTDATGRPLKD